MAALGKNCRSTRGRQMASAGRLLPNDRGTSPTFVIAQPDRVCVSNPIYEKGSGACPLGLDFCCCAVSTYFRTCVPISWFPFTRSNFRFHGIRQRFLNRRNLRFFRVIRLVTARPIALYRNCRWASSKNAPSIFGTPPLRGWASERGDRKLPEPRGKGPANRIDGANERYLLRRR
jgi:hypothetical protein